MSWIFLNDRFVRREEAVVSVFDHGFLYGDGVYETLRAYDRKLFMLRRHLARLERSARAIGLTLPVTDKEWPALLQEAMERNNVREAYLRITVSRGEGHIGLDPALCGRPTVVIVALPFQPVPAKWFQRGIDLSIVSIRRNHPAALSPQIKSLNFLNNILAKQEAIRAHAFDGLMLNTDGEVAECTTSNIFFLQGERLCTPAVSCGILDGITREVVLMLAREAGIAVEEGRYEPDALNQAGECFVTNTSMEIMPVRSIDSHVIGPGDRRPVTQRLQEAFRSGLPRFLEQ
jgi:branched-chain amino acid aminotransferase